MAASTTITFSKIDTPYAGTHGIVEVKIDWVGDGITGLPPDTDFDATDVVDILGRYCVLGVTQPGAVATGGVVPDADYDIAIEDEYGCDIFGGNMVDRSDTAAEQALPLIGAAYGSRLCAGIWTFKLTDQTVIDATGTCVLYFEI